MAFMIDTDLVSEILLGDGRWYKVEPGTFGVDNLYFEVGNPHHSPTLSTEPGLDTMGFWAKEKGSDTTICGRLDEVKSYRTIPAAKLPREIQERRARAQDPFLR